MSESLTYLQSQESRLYMELSPVIDFSQIRKKSSLVRFSNLLTYGTFLTYLKNALKDWCTISQTLQKIKKNQWNAKLPIS